MNCYHCGQPMTRGFEVIDLRTKKSHGVFDTLHEARGAVRYDRLRNWEIWHGGRAVVAYHDDGGDRWKPR